MHTLYTRQNCSNGLQKRFGVIKRTPLREVSNFIVAFQRKTEIVFVWNLNPYRLLFQPHIVRFGYRWLRHLSRNMQHWLNWGRKEYMFQYLLRTIVLDFMEFPDDRCHGWKLWMSKLSSELRLTVTCHMCSEQWICHGTSWYVPLMLFFDRYRLWETRSLIEVIWKAGVIEQKRQKRQKKKKRATKDHKNDWLTDATRLKLVMKSKWTRSSF